MLRVIHTEIQVNPKLCELFVNFCSKEHNRKATLM